MSGQEVAAFLAAAPGLVRDLCDEIDHAQALVTAVDAIKETGGSAVEIAGVRIEPCDEYGRTNTTRSVKVLSTELAKVEAERDAALAEVGRVRRAFRLARQGEEQANTMRRQATVARDTALAEVERLRKGNHDECC